MTNHSAGIHDVKSEGGGGVKATSFSFPKGKSLWEQRSRESSLAFNKTSHKTYLSKGRSTFAVWTVVNKLRTKYITRIVIVSTIRGLVNVWEISCVGIICSQPDSQKALFPNVGRNPVAECRSVVTELREGSGNRIPRLLIHSPDLTIIFTYWIFPITET